jgi:hypothetical protein
MYNIAEKEKGVPKMNSENQNQNQTASDGWYFSLKAAYAERNIEKLKAICSDPAFQSSLNSQAAKFHANRATEEALLHAKESTYRVGGHF